MATTHLPKYDRPIGMKMEEVREYAQEAMEFMQRDCDKAGDIDDANYYQGYVDALRDLLTTMTFPRCEADARECIHGHLVWLGHECGECQGTGIKWKDEA